MSGLFKGPLPVLILAGAGFLAYKYLPFGQIVDRFRQAEPVSATVTAPLGRSETTVAASAPTSGDLGADKPDAGARVAPPKPDDVPPQPASSTSDAATDLKVPRPIVAQVDPPTNRSSIAIGALKPHEQRGSQLAGIGALHGNDSVQQAGTINNSVVGSGVATSIGRTGVSITPKGRAVDPVSLQTVTPTAKPPTEKPIIVASRDDVPVAAVPANKPVAPSKPIAAPVPTLRILVEAETNDRAGTDQYTPTEYAAMLRKELIAIASGYLGAGHVGAADANLAFRDDLAAGRSGVDRLCVRAGSERLLLADLDVPSEGFSTIDSAYWPEVVFTAINCRDGRLHKSQETRLEPSRLDRFEYQLGFAERSQRFVATQAYFLRP